MIVFIEVSRYTPIVMYIIKKAIIIAIPKSMVGSIPVYAEYLTIAESKIAMAVKIKMMINEVLLVNSNEVYLMIMCFTPEDENLKPLFRIYETG
jgi:hypothetical protein